ncbi:MAG: hypothetical protein Q9199_000656 [Rusavskia elegans]
MAGKDSNIDHPNRTSSEVLKKQGNRLYKEGRVQQAIKSYLEAAVIAPSDPKPYYNLSAAHFELGDYRQCIQDISQALQRPSQDGSTLRRKLYPRLVKSCLHIKDIPAAEVNCAQMGDNPETAKLIAVCTTYRAASRQSAPAASQMIHQIPRYLPALDINFEYYAVGHDQACAQISLPAKQQESERLAAIFYLHAGSIIPSFAARMIQDTIKRVETALRSGQDLLLWLHIDKHSKEAILRSLRSWQRDVKSTFPVGMMVAIKLIWTSVLELPAVTEQKAFVARFQSMLLENTETIQKLNPAILRRAGLEHIRNMGPERVRKTDIRSLSSIDLDDHGVPYPLAEYLHWNRTNHGPLSFERLLPRPKLTTSLFTMFYKIVLPADRSSQEWGELVYAPLNLTIFIKILIHLHGLGYPAHWLSEPLVQVLKDQVTTSARSPESSPLHIAEAQRQNPTKHLTTAPFMAEMTTLTLVFLPTLPFAVIITTVPEVAQIHEYKITFKILIQPGDRIGLPVFVLIFWDDTLAKGVLGAPLDGFPEIRQILHPDGRLGHTSIPREEVQKLRQQGLRMVTTFQWNAQDSSASLCIPKKVIDDMQQSERWKSAILRTDRWEFASLSVPLLKTKLNTVSEGRRWID